MGVHPTDLSLLYLLTTRPRGLGGHSLLSPQGSSQSDPRGPSQWCSVSLAQLPHHCPPKPGSQTSSQYVSQHMLLSLGPHSREPDMLLAAWGRLHLCSWREREQVSGETDPVGLALPSQGMWGPEAAVHVRLGDLASDLYPQSLGGLICQWAIHTHSPAWYIVSRGPRPTSSPYHWEAVFPSLWC